MGYRGNTVPPGGGRARRRASATYYLKYYQQYYAGIWFSLHELRRVTRPGAPCVLVAQDTFYKELLNDTPGIMLEMAQAAGFSERTRYHFVVPRTKAGMNPKARQYRKSSAATESILVLRWAATPRLETRRAT